MNIKEKYKKEQKKQKAKTIVKWVLACSGWTLVLAMFIGLVALGVKGCNNKKAPKETQAQVIGDYDVTLRKRAIADYEYKYYYRTDTFSPNYIDMLNWNINEGAYWTDVNIKLKIKDDSIAGNNGYYHTLDTLGLNYDDDTTVIQLISYDENDRDLILYEVDYGGSVSIITSNIQVGYVDSTIDLYDLYNSDKVLRFFAHLMVTNSLPNIDKDFTFNSQINRYGPLQQANSVFARGSYLGTNWVFRGYFKDSNGNSYQGIKVTYAQANALGYLDPNSQTYKVFDQNGTAFIYLEYIKVDGTSVIVNTANYQIIDNKTTYTNTSRWVADSFRKIHIIYLEYVSSPLPMNDGSYSPLEILDSFNNDSIGFNGVGGEGGVFELIGNAFTGISSILNMQVLPYITLGTLIFIPFSIMILIACVWLFKR